MRPTDNPDPLKHLLDIMARLRDPQGGCVWDLEQTFATIAPHTIEEAYEVADAIEQSDMAALRDELGDLAASFNTMSRQLREAREEITAWTRELEKRVEQKTVELKRADEQMIQAEKLASTGKLAAIVAHEINNPLAGILTYAKLLKKWVAECDESKKEQIRSSLDLIESESRRCGEIVKNLLVFARAAPMNPHFSDLNAVLDRCVRLVRHQLDIAGIQAQLDLDRTLPPVFCDVAHIEQALLALVMNSIEALPRGGNLRLRSRHSPETKEAILQVQDDGAGIAPEVLPNLFEPFFTTRERGHSLGLGLAISRNIIERHRGRIEVESPPGRGTVFTITLPLRAQELIAAGESAQALPAGHRGEKS